MPEAHLGPTYRIESFNEPPTGYPVTSTPDSFTTSFSPDHTQRRQALFDYILKNSAPPNPKAPYYEIARMAAGGYPHQGVLQAALDFIDQRRDCADFTLHSIIRLLYQFSSHPYLSLEILERAHSSILDFKYWPDEPGTDSMCTWTENHYLLFASAAYLAGQLYQDSIFTNSDQSGREKMELNRARILRWMDLRFQTGFSEWLSNVYYDEDLTALLSLVDFCQDQDIRDRAAMLIDLLLLDIALNSFQGVFGSTHGRAYEHSKKWAEKESTSPTSKLLFGKGVFSTTDNMSAIAFALSPRYQLPQVIYDIATDDRLPAMENRQRMGIRLSQAARWGLNTGSIEDGLHFLTLEAYLHPKTAHLTLAMFDRFNWWENTFFSNIRSFRGFLRAVRMTGLLPLVAHLLEKDACRNTREEVNISTYRTPDYMLSSAQDYRKGYGGDQQHVWQATLGPGAVCFTTHPPRRSTLTPNYWTGSGTLPRVAQVKNVLIAVYNIASRPALYVPNKLFFTHAWLPKDAFEEVVEQDHWIFARQGEAYLALCSQQPYTWQNEPGEDQNRELIAKGKKNIWICELGRQGDDGDFPGFIHRILEAPLQFSSLRVVYESPSQGKLEFGWRDPLRQDGRAISLNDFPRYDNTYTQVSFPAEIVEIACGNKRLKLNWSSAQREIEEPASETRT